MRKSLPSEKYMRSRLAADTVFNFLVYDTVDSTNLEAKRYCQSGERLPAIFIARGQTGGRGRLGRSFDSMRDKGLYLTFAFVPEAGASPHSLTLTAGCAALLAIEELCGITPDIKWVNDLQIRGKKIAGILAEGAFDASGNMSYAIVGIGINIKKRRFPKELSDKVGTLEESANFLPDINELAAEIINRFFSLYGDLDTTLNLYRTHLSTLGKRVAVKSGDGEYLAMARELDGEGNLIVEREDGTLEKLFFGEISVITQE